MPRATVIIPTYNWSTVLPYAIGSVLAQSYRDFELLVIGDACTDDSADVVARAGDARVRWINLAENWGQAGGPYNEGIRQARGDVIAHLAHDDLWLPHHLMTLMEALDAGAAAAYDLAAYIETEGASPRVGPRRAHEFHPGKAMPPSCVVVRRDAMERIGPWRPYRALTAWPDTDVWTRLHEAGFPFQFVPRLGVIRFPASGRKDVYKLRPCHEQRAWSERIAREPDLEQRLLAQAVADLQPRAVQPNWRSRLMSLWRRSPAPSAEHPLDERRRFKGLERKP